MPGTMTPTTTPELLYLLHNDPAELTEALTRMRATDIAEALTQLPPTAAAKLMAALPFDATVEVFDAPELADHRCAIIQKMDQAAVGPLLDAMSADQQADLFRELPEPERTRLLGLVDGATRKALSLLLRYPSDTAAGIMTTEFVTIPSDWSVERALTHIRQVGCRAAHLEVQPPRAAGRRRGRPRHGHRDGGRCHRCHRPRADG